MSVRREFWLRDNVVARFFDRVDRNGPTPAHVPQLGQCWQWKAGYRAIFRVAAKMPVVASRASWMLFRSWYIGTRRPFVLHRCDNAACVNPEHLFLGTQSDNMLDAIRKGRHTSDVIRGRPNPGVQGERNGFSKLTTHKVRRIRCLLEAGNSAAYIATKFHVHISNVYLIRDRKAWSHA